MTTEQDQQSRAEFEAKMIAKWFFNPPAFAQNAEGDYLDKDAQYRWELWQDAWQAARALPAGMEPVGYLIDWPDEPDLGHYFAEGASTTGRSQPLHTAAQVQAMGRVPPGWVAAPAEVLELAARMVEAARCVLGHPFSGAQRDALERCADRMRAMLVATQRPPAAQERRPLTDEQIDELHGESSRGYDIEVGDYFKAFRDAEAAHGIKATP